MLELHSFSRIALKLIIIGLVKTSVGHKNKKKIKDKEAIDTYTRKWVIGDTVSSDGNLMTSPGLK